MWASRGVGGALCWVTALRPVCTRRRPLSHVPACCPTRATCRAPPRAGADQVAAAAARQVARPHGRGAALQAAIRGHDHGGGGAGWGAGREVTEERQVQGGHGHVHGLWCD